MPAAGAAASPGRGDIAAFDAVDPFEQATGYPYGWMVPPNVGALIEKRGGAEAALRDLEEHTRELDAGVYGTKGAYLSDQPSFTMPFVHHWMGRPDRTGEVLRLFDVALTDRPVTQAGQDG